MKKHLVTFTIGVLFGVGLLVSGMTDPSKVLGFLDITGDWDPSLAFVMVGAIAVHGLALRLIRVRASRPLFVATFREQSTQRIDLPLVLGAGVFGVGWGLVGVCPGPALVALGTGTGGFILFVASMAAGSVIASRLKDRVRSTDPSAPDAC